jgi:methylaspartate mutase sigma subunit
MNPPGIFVLSTVESDSHTWNLVYLQLLLEERGMDVVNLGACTPVAVIIESIKTVRPDVVIISSVNGCGFTQGRALITHAKECLGEDIPKFVIGGKLTTSADDRGIENDLLAAGFDGVFVGDGAVERFCLWLSRYQSVTMPDGARQPVILNLMESVS